MDGPEIYGGSAVYGVRLNGCLPRVRRANVTHRPPGAVDVAPHGKLRSPLDLGYGACVVCVHVQPCIFRNLRVAATGRDHHVSGSNVKGVGLHAVHFVDEDLDHGPILYQRELTLGAEETSKEVYERILATEMELMEEHLEDILTGNYTLTPMPGEGNINYKEDFEALRQIDRDKPATYGEVIDFLRAMTHQPYKNAYYRDADGKKIYVSIQLEKEQ